MNTARDAMSLEAQAHSLVAVELSRYHAALMIDAVTIRDGAEVLARARAHGEALQQRVRDGLRTIRAEMR